MKRDLIQEIITKRSHNLKRGNRSVQYFRKHNQIMDIYLFLEKNKKFPKKLRLELFRYIPIVLVTAIENYYRFLIRDLLIKGDPFLSNIASFKNVNIDFKSIIIAQSQSLTIPDLVSHSIPLSNLEDINSVLSTLLSCDFLAELKTAKIFGNEQPLDSSMKVFVESTIKRTKKVFELRNIFCHELAFNYRLSIREMKDIILAVHSLIIFTELYLHYNIFKA